MLQENDGAIQGRRDLGQVRGGGAALSGLDIGHELLRYADSPSRRSLCQSNAIMHQTTLPPLGGW